MSTRLEHDSLLSPFQCAYLQGRCKFSYLEGEPSRKFTIKSFYKALVSSSVEQHPYAQVWMSFAPLPLELRPFVVGGGWQSFHGKQSQEEGHCFGEYFQNLLFVRRGKGDIQSSISPLLLIFLSVGSSSQ